MSFTEYLLFIPLLIYGIVLSQLLGEWRRFFDLANWHWPYIITIVVFTEIAVWNIYTFLGVFTRHDSHSYMTYLGLLSAPFLFLLAVNALLVGEDDDGLVDRTEFRSRMPLSYFFMGCYVALHLTPLLSDGDEFRPVRIVALCMLFGVAGMRKEWMVYPLGVLWLGTLAIRIHSGS